MQQHSGDKENSTLSAPQNQTGINGHQQQSHPENKNDVLDVEAEPLEKDQVQNEGSGPSQINDTVSAGESYRNGMPGREEEEENEGEEAEEKFDYEADFDEEDETHNEDPERNKIY